MEREDIKSYLHRRLHGVNAFWSYNKLSCQVISDWNLIKFVLIHLDVDDIDLLFDIYPKKQIKSVWLEELVPQGEYLANMNLCFACIYFGIKHPVRYLKSNEKKWIERSWKEQKG
jgi:hypothetical protein